MNNYTESPPTPQPSRVSVSVDVFRDLFGIAGAGLAGYGAWLHYQPAGFILGGSMMVALAVVGTIRGRS